ncbi:hypothetical protein LC76P1_00009 [Lysinibacillus phage LC76P1]|nr:hypothetical protein LC76P1_00009 [Lysinibacillus phage LC76P1]
MRSRVFYSSMLAIYTIVIVTLTLTFYINLGGKPSDRSSRYRDVPVAEYVKSEPEYYSNGRDVKYMMAEFKINGMSYKIRMEEVDNRTLVAGAKYTLRYNTSDKVLRRIDMAGEGDESISK